MVKNIVIAILLSIITCNMNFWEWENYPQYFCGIMSFSIVWFLVIDWVDSKTVWQRKKEKIGREVRR